MDQELDTNYFQTSLPLLIFDINGNIVDLNPAIEILFGYQKDDLKGQSIQKIIPGKYKTLHDKIIGKDTNNSECLNSRSYEISGVNKDGSEIPIEILISKNSSHNSCIYTAILIDIRNRETFYEKLIQSSKLASVGELVSGITHDLNNPLAVIMGYAEMMMIESKMDDELKRSLEIIYGEADKARKIIRNLLSLTRKNTPEKENISINEVIEKTLNLTSYDLKKSNIKTVKRLNPELPNLWVDPNQIQQVFINLIRNAEYALTSTDYEKEIVVTSCIKQSPLDSDDNINEIVQITFENNGPGIPESIITNIFEPFYTTKPSGQGTGIGLAVSKRIVNDNGGDIYAKNNAGSGVAFFIDMPVN